MTGPRGRASGRGGGGSEGEASREHEQEGDRAAVRVMHQNSIYHGYPRVHERGMANSWAEFRAAALADSVSLSSSRLPADEIDTDREGKS